MTVFQKMENNFNGVYEEFKKYYYAFRTDTGNKLPEFDPQLPVELVSGIAVKFFDERNLKIMVDVDFITGEFCWKITGAAVYYNLNECSKTRNKAVEAALLKASEQYTRLYLK